VNVNASPLLITQGTAQPLARARECKCVVECALTARLPRPGSLRSPALSQISRTSSPRSTPSTSSTHTASVILSSCSKRRSGRLPAPSQLQCNGGGGMGHGCAGCGRSAYCTSHSRVRGIDVDTYATSCRATLKNPQFAQTMETQQVGTTSAVLSNEPCQINGGLARCGALGVAHLVSACTSAAGQTDPSCIILP